jgi:hypothetical protein
MQHGLQRSDAKKPVDTDLELKDFTQLSDGHGLRPARH